MNTTTQRRPNMAEHDDAAEVQRKRIGRNITIARAVMSQETLAALVGVGRPRVSEWEKGTYRPNDYHLERIAEELGRSVGWFYIDHPET
jgi:transcriptional regulator with XRE-family HTH domain